LASSSPSALPSRIELAVLALAIGGELLVLLGIARALRPPVLVVIGIAAVAAFVALARGTRPATWLFVLLAASPLFVLALYPPIAFDETLYHLPHLRAIAASGAIGFRPLLRFPLFPQLQELLCLVPFAALGDVAPHFVTVAELLLLGALVAAWPRQREAGLLAAALSLGHPIVVQLGTVTYVEIALTLFVAAGFFCLDRERPAAAGLLFAAACSVKYLAWYFAAAGFAFVLLFAVRRVRATSLFLSAFAAGILPTYGLLVATTHNPFFPFLPRLFGATPWALTNPRPAAPLVGALRVWWDITFDRGRVNWQPPYSPLFAIALWIAIVAAFRDRRAAFVAAISIGYALLFPFLPQDSRYLLPLLPLVSVTAATWIAARMSREATLALAIVAIVPAFAYAGYRIVRQGAPPLRASARRDYLEAHVPEFRALEHRGSGRVLVCGGEQLQDYGRGSLVGDVIGVFPEPRIFGASGTPAELAAQLRALRVSELLVSRRGCRQEWQRLAAPPSFELAYADGGALLWRVAALQSAK
jgi:hypothetical protein